MWMWTQALVKGDGPESKVEKAYIEHDMGLLMYSKRPSVSEILRALRQA